MGMETGILQRCGLAVAVLALLAPTTIPAASQVGNPFLGNVACLSDEQRTELVHREMIEFMVVGKEYLQSKRLARDALAGRDEAAAGLKGCQQAAGPLPGAPCEAQRDQLARAENELEQANARQEIARTEMPAVAAARIQAVRAEYPACDSR
jgi:hypothetical protein